MDTEYATIVKLSPSTEPIGVVSFEQAFGEHSEFKGRGRARRQKRRQARRLKRIHDRQERQNLRQEGRLARKKRRKDAKNDGDEDEEAPAEEGAAPEEGAPEEESQDQGQDPAAEEGQDPAADEAESFDGDYDSADGDYDSADGDYDSADGDYDSAEGDPDQSGAIGPMKKKLHPEIKELSKKIVWNKEAIRRHKNKKRKYEADFKRVGENNKNNTHAPQLSKIRKVIQVEDMEIQKHEDRLKQLQDLMKTKFHKHPHVKHALKHAHGLLRKHKEKKASFDDQSKVQETLIDKSLDPSITTDKIEIPAQPVMRTVELSSSADGLGDKIKSMSFGTKLVIGVAVVGVLAYLAKKHKVI